MTKKLDHLKLLSVFILTISLSCFVSSESTKRCREEKYDLYFMVEASNFIGQANIDTAKTFFEHIMASFNLGDNNTHISVSSYGQKIENLLSLAESSNPARIYDAVDKLTSQNGYGVWTHTFMDYANDHLFTEAYGRRKDEAEAICILLTGYTFSGNYFKPAAKLRENCRVVVIGVKYYRLTQLYAVGSKPTIKHAYHSRTYSGIISKVSDIVDVICNPPLASPTLKRTGISFDRVTIEWLPQKYALKYDAMLRPRRPPRRVKRKFGLKNVNSVTFVGLKESTQYYVYVWPIDSKGERGPQAALIVTTGVKMPDMKISKTEVTETTAVIRWNKYLRGGKHHVYVHADDDTKDFQTQIASGKSRVLTKLTPGTAYKAKLGYIYTPKKDLEDAYGTPFYTKCLPPSILVIDFGKTSATLAWDPMKGADHYKIFMRVTETGKKVTIDNVKGETYKVEGLKPTHTYSFSGLCVNKWGVEGKLGKASAVLKAPDNPQLLTFYDVTENQVSVSWEKIEDAVKYRILLSDAFNSEMNETVMTSDTNSTFTGLQHGTLYVVTAYSVGKADKQDFDDVYPTKFTTKPRAPRNIEKTPDVFSFNLKWNPVRGAIKYEIYRKSFEVYYEEIDGVKVAVPFSQFVTFANTSDSELTMTNLSPASSFEFKVRSIGLFDVHSDFSDTVWVQTLPSKDYQGRVTNVTENTASVNWKPTEEWIKPLKSFHSGVYSYLVLVATDGANVAQYKTRETRIQLSRLTPGGIYTVSIYPMQIRAELDTAHAQVFGFQTLPSPPRNFKITSSNATTFHVECEKVKGAIGYRFVFDASNPNEVQKDESKINEFVIKGSNKGTITGFDPGEVYKVSVYSINFNEKESKTSPEKPMTTKPVPPTKPTVVSFGRTYLDLEWLPVIGVKSFSLTLSEMINSKAHKTWVIKNIENTDIDLKSLVPGMIYSVFIKNENKFHTEDQTSEKLYTQTTLNKPKNLRKQEVTTEEATIEWDEVYGSNKYVVTKLNVDEDGSQPKEYDIFENKIKFEGLLDGTTYEFQVKPFNTDYNRTGGISSTYSVVTDPLPPTKPVMEHITSKCIDISWNSTRGAYTYEVHLVSSTENYHKEIMGLRAHICGLTSNTQYEISVKAVGAQSSSEPSSILLARTTLIPPTNLYIRDVEERAARLEWDSIDGAVSYLITMWWLDYTQKPFKQVMTSTNNSISLTSLEPSVHYTYTVQVKNVEGRLSETSFERTFATFILQEPPRLEETTSTSLTLMWDFSPAITDYEVYLEAASYDFSAVVSAKSSPATFEGLKAGSKYYSHIVAFSDGGESRLATSNTTTIFTLTEQPSNLTIVHIDEISMMLEWLPVFGAESYELHVHQSGVKVADIEISGSEFNLDGLVPGLEYQLSLWSIGENGALSGEPARVSEFTLPPAPKVIEISENTEKSFLVSWGKVSGAIGYYVLMISDHGVKHEYNVDETEVSATELTADTYYNVTVYSIGSRGKRNPRGTTAKEAMTAPSSPTKLEVYDVTEASTSIKWNPVAGVAYYSIAFSINDSSTPFEENRFDTEMGNFTIDFLQPSVVYAISIQCVGLSGLHSTSSETINFITKPVTPNQPSVIDITKNSATIEWESSEGADSYVVHVFVMGNQSQLNFTTAHNYFHLERWLISGERYQVGVQAIGPLGDLSLDISLPFDFQTLIEAPKNFRSEDVDVNFIKLAWDSVYGASAYNVRAYTNEILAGEMVTGTSNAEFYLLKPGTSYLFVINSYDHQNQMSEDSEEHLESTLPAQPIVFLKSIASNEVSIRWKPVQGAVLYRVFTSGARVKKDKIILASEPQALLTNLHSGMWYTFVVFSLDNRNRSEAYGSVPVSVQTIPSEEFQYELHSQLSISRMIKDSKEMPSHLKIMLDSWRPSEQRPTESKYDSGFMYGKRENNDPPTSENNEQENEPILKNFMDGGFTSFDTRAMQCSFQCFPGTVTKKFVPMSMMREAKRATEAEVQEENIEEEEVSSGEGGSGNEMIDFVHQELQHLNDDKQETATTNLDDVLDSFIIDM